MCDRSTPCFDEAFQTAFRELVLWRRDVRRFKDEPVDKGLVLSLVELAAHAPSVGLSQPWRFVFVESETRREVIRQSFARANADALAAYAGEQRRLYARLKLEGLSTAPIQLAVFADEATSTGSGLGRRTMPEMLRYSVVCAVQTLWLAASAHGLGVGWVSILEPDVVRDALQVPNDWPLVAYLCIGWPQEQHLDPELERHKWEARVPMDDFILVR